MVDDLIEPLFYRKSPAMALTKNLPHARKQCSPISIEYGDVGVQLDTSDFAVQPEQPAERGYPFSQRVTRPVNVCHSSAGSQDQGITLTLRDQTGTRENPDDFITSVPALSWSVHRRRGLSPGCRTVYERSVCCGSAGVM